MGGISINSLPDGSIPPLLLWGFLLAGPALFLIAIGAASLIVRARSAVPADEIPAQVAQSMPQLLFVVQVGLALVVTALYFRVGAVQFFPATPSRTVMDLVIGVSVGAVLAACYIWWLAPALEYLQRTFGDYVPPGEVLVTVSGSLVIFFFANVLLAPLVEEILYRGYALPLLSQSVGIGAAVLISCGLFGLLHWPGGVWYMLLTGVVAGGTFAGLYLWRENVLLPFVAHLTLNGIEFIYAARLRAVEAAV